MSAIPKHAGSEGMTPTPLKESPVIPKTRNGHSLPIAPARSPAIPQAKSLQLVGKGGDPNRAINPRVWFYWLILSNFPLRRSSQVVIGKTEEIIIKRAWY